jgi:hypothetical protein
MTYLMGLFFYTVVFLDLCFRRLTSGHESQPGSTGHEHRVEVGDGAGSDDVPSNGLGQAERMRA